MIFRTLIYKKSLPAALLSAASLQSIYAQSSSATAAEDMTMWYLMLLVLGGALAAMIFVWRKKKAEAANSANDKATSSKSYVEDGSHTFDADEELEWLRKNNNVINRKRRKTPASNPKNETTANVAAPSAPVEVSSPSGLDLLANFNSPVFEFERIEPPAPVEPLPLSNDDALLNAIEQSQDEDEEDEEIREVSLRILAAFKTRNSVEALSQMAIYDLSSAIRSKAVTILSEFDHESVFETILLACADPTREVRAAAARAFSRLSFDRADAWARIIETNEKGRMVHAARAAIEGGFVERSFERLTHRDKHYSYEAFTLVALLIKAGEVQQISEAISKNRDLKVKRAIIHALKVVKDENSLTVLSELSKAQDLPEELRQEVETAIGEHNLATA